MFNIVPLLPFLDNRRHLNSLCRQSRVGLVTAAKVIEEMDGLPPDEQAKVIQHALELARHRQLSADELGDLAERLAASNDPAEIIRLKSAMKRGFYGE
jgi:hypothetical protein